MISDEQCTVSLRYLQSMVATLGYGAAASELDVIERYGREQRQAKEAAENDLLDALSERDEITDKADRLAYTVGGIEHIGEHSSSNDPIENATRLAAETNAEVARQRDRADRLERELAEYRAVVGKVRAWANMEDTVTTNSLIRDGYETAQSQVRSILPAVQPEGSEPR